MKNLLSVSWDDWYCGSCFIRRFDWLLEAVGVQPTEMSVLNVRSDLLQRQPPGRPVAGAPAPNSLLAAPHSLLASPNSLLAFVLVRVCGCLLGEPGRAYSSSGEERGEAPDVCSVHQ